MIAPAKARARPTRKRSSVGCGVVPGTAAPSSAPSWPCCRGIGLPSCLGEASASPLGALLRAQCPHSPLRRDAPNVRGVARARHRPHSRSAFGVAAGQEVRVRPRQVHPCLEPAQELSSLFRGTSKGDKRLRPQRVLASRCPLGYCARLARGSSRLRRNLQVPRPAGNGRRTGDELPREGADGCQEASGADVSHHHLLQIQTLRPQLVFAFEEAGERLRQFTRRLKALPGGMR